MGWMKGLVIGLDALVALVFVIIAMVIIASQTYHPRTPEIVYLKELVMDTMIVLDKTGAIADAIDGNITTTRAILEATPTLACINISVVNATGDLIATTVKSGCDDTTDLDIQTAALPTIHDYGRYAIKAEAWFRKEAD
jgi:hypothetical protein